MTDWFAPDSPRCRWRLGSDLASWCSDAGLEFCAFGAVLRESEVSVFRL